MARQRSTAYQGLSHLSSDILADRGFIIHSRRTALRCRVSAIRFCPLLWRRCALSCLLTCIRRTAAGPVHRRTGPRTYRHTAWSSWSTSIHGAPSVRYIRSSYAALRHLPAAFNLFVRDHAWKFEHSFAWRPHYIYILGSVVPTCSAAETDCCGWSAGQPVSYLTKLYVISHSRRLRRRRYQLRLLQLGVTELGCPSLYRSAQLLIRYTIIQVLIR